MTKIPIDDFPAGPRLDAEVARILEWTELRKMKCCDDWKGKPPGGPWYVIPRYSTDIGAAWKLVERLIESIPEIAVSHEHTTLPWLVILNMNRESIPTSPDDIKSAKGGTAPSAITRAFLKASGVEEIEVENQGGEVETNTLAPSSQATERPSGTTN